MIFIDLNQSTLTTIAASIP